MGVSHFDGSNKTGTRYPFRSRGTVPGMLEHPTDREKKKKHTHTHIQHSYRKRDTAHHSSTHTRWWYLRISRYASEFLATVTAILSSVREFLILAARKKRGPFRNRCTTSPTAKQTKIALHYYKMEDVLPTTTSHTGWPQLRISS